jgi:soluble lytic murein transglycosylase
MSKKKKPRWKRKRLFLLVLIVVLAALFIRSEWIGRLIYPVSFADEIKQNALLYGQDPLLIAAIIRVESNYDENAVSPKGAVGIMQLMPETATWILKQERFGDLTLEDAGSRASAGIRLGTWYVKELKRRFGDQLPAVLAAYNAGPNRVRQWLDDKVWDGSEGTVQNIPYGETRHYVQRVLYYYKKYQDIYGEWR